MDRLVLALRLRFREQAASERSNWLSRSLKPKVVCPPGSALVSVVSKVWLDCFERARRGAVPNAAARAKLEPAPKRVLFLCTGNSARSQMAEAILRHLGGGRYEVFSAGTQPHASVHPEALGVLEKYRVPRAGLRPKDLSVFATESFDYVITLCDRALEQCPMRPGADIVHWTFPDPVEMTASKRRRAFEDTYHGLARRIQLFLVINARNESRR